MTKKWNGFRINIITQISHLPEVEKALADVVADPGEGLVYGYYPSTNIHAVFCNPNAQRFKLDEQYLSGYPDLRVICTASTGLTHIDMAYCEKRGIDVISLRGDPVLVGIPSTAEHAFGLMLAALRHYPAAFDQVRRGEWDWSKLPPARQVAGLTVGVIGAGRLGEMMGGLCWGARMNVELYDTAKVDELVFFDDGYGSWQIKSSPPTPAQIAECDVISFHIPAEGNEGLVDESWFQHMKDDVVIVNTSRGEIIDEVDLIHFLVHHPNARFAADVIADEQNKSTLLWELVSTDHPINYGQSWAEFQRSGNQLRGQIILTPHIGSATIDAQRVAYLRAVEKLAEWQKEPQ